MFTVVEVDPEPIKKSKRDGYLGITYRWYIWNGWDNCFTYRTQTLEEAVRYAALMEWTRQRVDRTLRPYAPVLQSFQHLTRVNVASGVHPKLLRNRPVTIPRRAIH